MEYEDDMNKRRPFVIGSIPQDSAENAIRWQLEQLPGLPYFSGGETGERSNWIVPFIESLRGHPDLEVKREGSWKGYKDLLVHRVKRGHKLTGASMQLGTLERTREELRLLDRLTEGQQDRPTLLVSMPDYLNLALFSLGQLGPLTQGNAFLDLVVGEITETQRELGDRVIFQLEAPLQFVATAKSGPLAGPTSVVMSRLLTRVPRRVPAGTRFGVHLCLGDLNHEALTPLRSAEPIVYLFNSLTRIWPSDRPLEYVHAPLAGGPDPVPTDPRFYEAFERFCPSPPTRFVAGIVQEEQGESDQILALKRIEEYIGTVDVAAYCGLGRRSFEAAQQNADRARSLTAA